MPMLETSSSIRPKFEKIITGSDLMLPVFDHTSRAADVDATVLITGESGTGKELIAHAIHTNSARREDPFVIVNMAAVPETLIESELFGHLAGAFTGSTGTRVGRIEAAHKGTLFIDEIGDLALESQAKLLRVLEDHKITPVGGSEEKEVNVRVIAATNRNLERMVRNGEFREELYYRLNVLAIHLPALRERSEDVELLANHFLDEFAVKHDRPRPAVDSKLLGYLEDYDWPGNIRQLRNCVESMVVMSDSSTLTMDDLPAMVQGRRRGPTADVDLPNDLTLEDMTREMIRQRLAIHRGNRTRAAQSLGISVRTLQRRLKDWERNGEPHC